MKMKKNSILDEIHKIRIDYAERFGNDLHAICQYARQKQGRDGRQVIPANPKPASNFPTINRIAQ
jgi:hypothetical protein